MKRASNAQRRLLHELGNERGVRPVIPASEMTAAQAAAEIDRIKALPQKWASRQQVRLIKRLAKERGVRPRMPRRHFTAKKAEREIARLLDIQLDGSTDRKEHDWQ